MVIRTERLAKPYSTQEIVHVKLTCNIKRVCYTKVLRDTIHNDVELYKTRTHKTDVSATYDVH